MLATFPTYVATILRNGIMQVVNCKPTSRRSYLEDKLWHEYIDGFVSDMLRDSGGQANVTVRRSGARGLTSSCHDNSEVECCSSGGKMGLLVDTLAPRVLVVQNGQSSWSHTLDLVIGGGLSVEQL